MKKKETAKDCMKKADRLLTIIIYMENDDTEDLKWRDHELLESVGLKASDSIGSVVFEAGKMYRRAFRKLKNEMRAGGSRG